MELVSICLFIVFCFLIAHDFRKSVLILGPLFILCQPYMCLRYNSPAVSLLFLTQFVILFFFFIKRKNLRFSQFPLKKAFCFLFFTLGMGLIVSPHNAFSLAPWLLSQVVAYLFVVIYYNELQSYDDAKLSLKSLFTVASILMVYFIFELITQSNPFIQSLYDMLGMEKGWVYPITERFGLIRCQSFMSICIAWGGFCCIMFVAIRLAQKYKIFLKKNVFFLCMALLAIMGVYFCGSRSAYIFLFIILCALFSDLKGKRKVMITLVLFVCCVFLSSSILSFVGSVFSDNVAGSSTSMRQMQFLATFSAIMESPLWGFGIKGFELAVAEDSDILGAESIWLQIMISYGLIGVLMQAYLYWSCREYVKKYGNKSSLCNFLLLGWIFFCTMTTSPGLTEPYFLMILILFCRTVSLSINSVKFN